MVGIQVLHTGVLSVNTIIVQNEDKSCFVVDPAACKFSMDEDKITNYLVENGLDCKGIILTHSHFDHVMGIDSVKKSFPNAKILIHEAEFDEMTNPPGKMGEAVIEFFGVYELLAGVKNQPSADIALKDNQYLDCISEKNWKVIHTPGHTPGSICLYNEKENVLISGDTLFDYGGYGRTDMAGGNETEIRKSLAKLQRIIPKGTKVYPGHDSYGFVFNSF